MKLLFKEETKLSELRFNKQAVWLMYNSRVVALL
jgi:hypothetical protein